MTKLQIVYKTFDFSSNKEIYKKATVPFDENTMIYDERLSFRDNVDEFLDGTMNKGIVFLDDNTAISVLSIVSFSKLEGIDSSNSNSKTRNILIQENTQTNSNKKNFKKRYGRRPHFENKQVQNPVNQPVVEKPVIDEVACSISPTIEERN